MPEEPNEAKPSGSHGLVLLMAGISGAKGIAIAVRLATGVITARLVSPSTFGLFSAINLVFGYLPFLQLGVFNGLSRELPYLIGKGDVKRAHALTAAAQGWSMCIGGLAAAAMAVLSAYFAWHHRWDMCVGWAANTIAAYLLFWGQSYLQVTYRTQGDFAKLSGVTLAQNTLSFALLPVVRALGFYGLCIRSAVVGIANSFLLWWLRPVRVPPRWDLADTVHLLKIGGPILIVSQLFAWWMVLDSTLVLLIMGHVQLGYYALVTITESVAAVLYSTTSQILYPKMAQEYGRTGSAAAMVALARWPTICLAAAMGLIVPAGWFLIPALTRALLPKYAPGIAAAQWALVAAAALSFIPSFSGFIVMRRLKPYAFAMAVGTVANLLAVTLLLRNGHRLTAFPQALCFGYVAYAICGHALLRKCVRDDERLRIDQPNELCDISSA